MSSSPELEDPPVSKKRKVTTPKPKKEKKGGGGERTAKAHIAETVEQLSDVDRLMLAMKKDGSPMKDIVKAVSDLTGKPANKNTVSSRIFRLQQNLKIWPDDHTAKLLQIKKEIEGNLEKSKMAMIAIQLKEQIKEDYSTELVTKKCKQLDRDGIPAPVADLLATLLTIPKAPGTPQATTKKVAAPRKTSAKKSATPKQATRAPTPTLTNSDASENEDGIDEDNDEEVNGDKGDGDGEIEDEDADIKAEPVKDQSEGDENMDDEIEDFFDAKPYEI